MKEKPAMKESHVDTVSASDVGENPIEIENVKEADELLKHERPLNI